MGYGLFSLNDVATLLGCGGNGAQLSPGCDFIQFV